MKRQLKLYVTVLVTFGFAGFLTVQAYGAYTGDYAPYAVIYLAMMYPALVIGTYAMRSIIAGLSGRRMYTRPDAAPESTLAYAVRSVLIDISYTTKEVDLVKIPFESGDVVTIDLAELWDVLHRAKTRGDRGVLGWQKSVVKGHMSKQLWLAYRAALIGADAAEKLGSGELRLYVEPWRAVELVRMRFSKRGKWQAFWDRRKAKQTENNRTRQESRK